MFQVKYFNLLLDSFLQGTNKLIWLRLLGIQVKTHLSQDKMAAISQTAFSNAFLWMESFIFQFKFHGSLFTKVQCSSIGAENGLALIRRQAIIWTNADPIHWRIYATQGGDELLAQVIRCIGRVSLLASLYNPKVNPAMVSTVRFYDRNELYGSPDVRNCRMPNFLGWAFFCY